MGLRGAWLRDKDGLQGHPPAGEMAMASRANQQRTLLVPASFQDLGELRGSWRTLMLTGLLASLGANHKQSSSTDKIASFLCLKESLPLFSRCRPIYMLNLHLQPQPLLLAAVTLFPTLASSVC